MSERFFASAPIVANRALLTDSEAHHLVHVMRAPVGSRVTLFDGSGAEFTAKVLRIGRSDVELEVLERLEIVRELPVPIVLGVALPKGDRQKWLIEKAVELGAARVVPLRTARGVAQPVQQALVRLERSVVEASKQCGRNRLMELSQPQDWHQFVTAEYEAQWRVVAHPALGRNVESAKTLPPVELGRAGGLYFAVGPEGGLTAEEVALAVRSGWRLIDLGARILRTETAAIALAAWASRQVEASGTNR